MRLNAYLARAGIASRRGADELIRAGRVRVNGEPAGLATFVDAGDRVEVDGEPVAPEPLAYVLLNKPAGVVTTVRRSVGSPRASTSTTAGALLRASGGSARPGSSSCCTRGGSTR